MLGFFLFIFYSWIHMAFLAKISPIHGKTLLNNLLAVRYHEVLNNSCKRIIIV